jgi:hypothetical protein
LHDFLYFVGLQSGHSDAGSVFALLVTFRLIELHDYNYKYLNLKLYMSDQIEDRPVDKPEVDEPEVKEDDPKMEELDENLVEVVPEEVKPPVKTYAYNESSPSSSSGSSPDQSEVSNTQSEDPKKQGDKDRSFVNFEPTKDQLKAELEGRRIDPHKDYVSPDKRRRFREKVAEELVQVAVEKPDWARYNVYQPDFYAFEAEIQEMILTLLEPAMRKIYENEA